MGRGIKTRNSQAVDKRKILYEMCGGVCPECGKKMSIKNPRGKASYMTIDHIVPKSLGGTNNIENLRGLCKDCNAKRGNDMTDVKSRINEMGLYVSSIKKGDCYGY